MTAYQFQFLWVFWPAFSLASYWKLFLLFPALHQSSLLTCLPARQWTAYPVITTANDPIQQTYSGKWNQDLWLVSFIFGFVMLGWDTMKTKTGVSWCPLVKDPVVLLLWLRSLLWHRFDPWPENLHNVSGVVPSKKKARKQKQSVPSSFPLGWLDNFLYEISLFGMCHSRPDWIQ